MNLNRNIKDRERVSVLSKTAQNELFFIFANVFFVLIKSLDYHSKDAMGIACCL